MEEGAQQFRQLSHTVRTQQPRDCGSLFNFWVWSGEGAQLLAWRQDCMGFAMQATTEWKRGHIWDILATVQPHSLGTGDKCPIPCFRVLFGNVQQCSILRDKTTGDLKSHHLQAGVTALSVPHLFFQQNITFKGTHSLFGGGGARAPQTPPWVRHCQHNP